MYCGWSGQTPNLEKSDILFSKNTTRRNRKEVKEVTDLKEMVSSTIYLGNSLVMGRNFSKEFTIIKYRVSKRLEGWNNHLLSKVGKAVLIKTMVQAIPTYTMSTFKLPSGVCNDLDRALKRFWWSSKQKSGRYLALKKWDDIYKPKEQGGWDLGGSVNSI